jgi:predicted flavoprotein YhiN
LTAEQVSVQFPNEPRVLALLVSLDHLIKSCRSFFILYPEHELCIQCFSLGMKTVAEMEGRKPQNIVVIGAGPVGSLAALYAATRGDHVELYELRGGAQE